MIKIHKKTQTTNQIVLNSQHVVELLQKFGIQIESGVTVKFNDGNSSLWCEHGAVSIEWQSIETSDYETQLGP